MKDDPIERLGVAVFMAIYVGEVLDERVRPVMDPKIMTPELESRLNKLVYAVGRLAGQAEGVRTLYNAYAEEFYDEQRRREP
jgi:hypothetical protein